MDIVSFETAKKLKNAGFPQPEYIQLGFGYTDDGPRFYIEDCSFPKGGVDGMCYAPTATDILRVLWFLFDLKFGGNGKWLVCRANSLSDGPSPFHEHDNSAEACAAAWLEENKKNG